MTESREHGTSSKGGGQAEPAGAGRSAGEIRLPGGGVLKPREPGTADLPVGFADLVRPFLLMGLAGLGVLPDPETGRTAVRLEVARAAIEILRLLRSRTEGHRSEEEERLLTEALFELEMQFVEVEKRRDE